MPIKISDIPFTPRRIFTVTNVPDGAIRGNHRTNGCTQLLVCIRPAIHLSVGFERGMQDIWLNKIGESYLLGPGEYVSYSHSSEESVLVVFADKEYDAASQLGTPVDQLARRI